jgi:hypothetical protein
MASCLGCVSIRDFSHKLDRRATQTLKFATATSIGGSLLHDHLLIITAVVIATTLCNRLLSRLTLSRNYRCCFLCWWCLVVAAIVITTLDRCLLHWCCFLRWWCLVFTAVVIAALLFLSRLTLGRNYRCCFLRWWCLVVAAIVITTLNRRLLRWCCFLRWWCLVFTAIIAAVRIGFLRS